MTRHGEPLDKQGEIDASLVPATAQARADSNCSAYTSMLASHNIVGAPGRQEIAEEMDGNPSVDEMVAIGGWLMSGHPINYVYPTAAESGRHRRRARLLLLATCSTPTGTGNGLTTTACASISSPRRSPRLASKRWMGSRHITY
jgi:hypothetical protein